MKNNEKRFAALLLCCLLSFGFASCGGDKDTVAAEDTAAASDSAQTDAAETDQPEETRIPLDAAGANYDGYEFRIWNYDNYTDNTWDPHDIPNDAFSDGLNGEMLNDSVYNRNKLIEEKLNISIKGQLKTANQMYTDLNQTVMSGSDDTDLVIPNLRAFASLVNSDLLLDMRDSGAFSFDQVWWDSETNDMMTIRGKLFGVFSDITYFDKLSTIVTFFNQKLAQDYQLGNIYEVVENNSWTIDNLLEMGKGVSADLNNDGAYDMNDAFPLSCQNDAAYYYLHGARKRICEQDSDGKLVFTLTEPATMDVLQKIYELMANKQQFLNRQTFNATLQDAINMFCENRVMFLTRPLQSLFLMRNMEADFGILPLPKMTDSQQEYGSAVNAWAGTIMCFPKTLGNIDRSGTVADMMAWESHYSVIKPLYSTILGSKLVRDESAAKMLDIVFDSVVYDIGMIWSFGAAADKLISYKKTDVASLVASLEKAVNKDIEKFEAILDDLS